MEKLCIFNYLCLEFKKTSCNYLANSNRCHFYDPSVHFALAYKCYFYHSYRRNFHGFCWFLCVKKNLSFCMVCLQRTDNFARRKKPLKLVCQSEFFTSCQSALIASAYVTQLKVKFCLPGQQPDSWCFWAISEMNPLFWSFVVRMNPIGMTCKVQMMIAKLVYSDILGQSKLVQSWAATKYKRENEE